MNEYEVICMHCWWQGPEQECDVLGQDGAAGLFCPECNEEFDA